MKQNTKLQQEIAELTAKHEWNEQAAELMGDLKHMALIYSSGKGLNVQIESTDEFKKVLEILPPTNETTTIGSASGTLAEYGSPFRIDIQNPASPSASYPHCLEIEYQSNDIQVEIRIPINLVESFIMRTKRKITDSEYHYFTGTAYNKLRTMDVMAYTFSQSNEIISWYGGNKTLKNADAVNEIINHLTK